MNKTFRIDGRMTVGKLKEEFKKNFGGCLHVKFKNREAHASERLSSLYVSSGEFNCYNQMTVGAFKKKMFNSHNLNVNVFTPKDWVAFPDGFPLAHVQDINGYQNKKDVMLYWENLKKGSKTKLMKNVVVKRLPTASRLNNQASMYVTILHKQFSEIFLDNKLFSTKIRDKDINEILPVLLHLSLSEFCMNNKNSTSNVLTLFNEIKSIKSLKREIQTSKRAIVDKLGKGDKNLLSLFSLFCYCYDAERDFPIYDSQVAQILTAYQISFDFLSKEPKVRDKWIEKSQTLRKKGTTGDFHDEALNTFYAELYCPVILSFRQNYKLTQYSLMEVNYILKQIYMTHLSGGILANSKKTPRSSGKKTKAIQPKTKRTTTRKKASKSSKGASKKPNNEVKNTVCETAKRGRYYIEKMSNGSFSIYERVTNTTETLVSYKVKNEYKRSASGESWSFGIEISKKQLNKPINEARFTNEGIVFFDKNNDPIIYRKIKRGKIKATLSMIDNLFPFGYVASETTHQNGNKLMKHVNENDKNTITL